MNMIAVVTRSMVMKNQAMATNLMMAMIWKSTTTTTTTTMRMS